LHLNVFTVDIVCAARNSNVLGELCLEIRRRDLEGLLGDCNRRLTLFAPSNTAFNIFFDQFNDEFFDEPDNFPLQSFGDLVLADMVTARMADLQSKNSKKIESMPLLDDRGGRNLQNQVFKNDVMTAILSYHVANKALKQADLSCTGTDQFIRMVSRGFSTTTCEMGLPDAQMGTCNNQSPVFDQVDIAAANGYIQVVTHVLIPSPNGKVDGCDLIGPP
jgi:uncharacterized surface protein with fasciclin (FAS1) repeats